MRLPYTPNPPTPANADDAAIVDRISARRKPRPLQPLDLALLHAPPLADGWNSFIGAIRGKTEHLGDGLRELAISRIAVVNKAWYEWGHHAPLAKAAGVSDAGLEVVKTEGALALADYEKVAAASGLTPTQWAVLVYTDEMTRSVEVADGTFVRLQELFDERQIVELTLVVSAYNCVSRFLVALNVGERNGTGPEAV